LYFDNVNYLFNQNPSYDELDINGICHMVDKNIISKFKTII
jgi:hypothetical protein